MEFGQVSFGGVVFLVAFGLMCEARYLSKGTPIFSRIALRPAQFETQAAAEVETHRKPAREPTTKFQQSEQTLQETKPLAWKYPEDSVPVAKPAVKFELREPVQPESVAARCGENVIHVEVKQDLLGIGQLIQPDDLTLGGCGAAEAEYPTDQIILFESELQDCGSTLTMTENALVYAFRLVYQPQALGNTSIERTGSAVVGIECHYLRKQNVSSSALKPTWLPYSASNVAEEQLYFSLRLMTDDWKFERPSSRYFLGGVLNIEAAVIQYKHSPLRVFVDSCVASLVPDPNEAPRYSFIDHHGCLVDAKLTGSNSQFMPRSQEDKLQFQLEAFRFSQSNNGSIYITCHLKATAASSPITVDHKACSFIDGWRAVGGDDQVCGCCDSVCGIRRDLTMPGDQWDATTTLGPIDVE